ncbi:hypothetical protein GQ457_01G007770 [Hibiscus cannabinus]
MDLKCLADTDGKFKENVIDDDKGMLSLYEAAHWRVHGEYILEEALTFTTVNLKSLAKKSSPHDTFDSYGTLQELQRLIDTLKRWEIGALDDLQDYTEVICKVVLVVFDEIAEEASRDGRSYGVPYAFIGMGEMAGIEAFEWLRKEPKIMNSINVIGRLMDDTVSHKFEQLREHASSDAVLVLRDAYLSVYAM